MDLNKKIYKFLHPEGCWHEWQVTVNGKTFPADRCSKCHWIAGETQSPAYDSNPADMVRLMEALREKDEDYRIRLVQWRNYWNCQIWHLGYVVAEAEAETPMLALALAVGKMIDAPSGGQDGQEER